MSIEKRLSNIRSLDIPVHKGYMRSGGEKVPSFKDFQDQLTISPSSISLSTRSLSAQNKEDISDAKMLAQLATDKKFDAGKDPVSWYNNYVKILSNLGFVYSDVKLLQYKSSSADVSIEKSLFEIMGALLEGGKLGALKKACDVLKNLNEGSSTVSIFNHSNSQTDFKNVQVSYSDLDENGAPRISMGAFVYSNVSIKGSFLFFFHYNISDISTKTGTTTMSMNSGVYSIIRETVKQKLGAHSEDFVNNLEL